MTSFSATVQTVVDLPPEQAFLGVVPIDLRKVFPGYGPLPAILGVKDQVGGWDAAGQTRSPQLSDGSFAHEQIVDYRKPEYFSYTVGGFSGAFRFITSSAFGEWWFEPAAPGKTHIRWRYTYHSRHALAVPLLWLIVHLFWRGYMEKSLRLTRRLIEAGAA